MHACESENLKEKRVDYSNMLDKSKYDLMLSEGKGLLVSQVRVIRLDRDPISSSEVKDLESEFKRLFPSNKYRIRVQTKPAEDDVILHIYITLNPKESLSRSKILGKRVIVPAKEIQERLEDW